MRSRPATPARLPDFVEPMKAKLVESMPSSGGWIYEIKFDGYRALALRGGCETQILSRNQKDLGGKFPEAKDSIALDIQDAIIDGEIIALDGKGRSSFQLLQGQDMGQGADTNRFSTLLICSGSTAKTFRVYRSKNERQNWKSC